MLCVIYAGCPQMNKPGQATAWPSSSKSCRAKAMELAGPAASILEFTDNMSG